MQHGGSLKFWYCICFPFGCERCWFSCSLYSSCVVCGKLFPSNYSYPNYAKAFSAKSSLPSHGQSSKLPAACCQVGVHKQWLLLPMMMIKFRLPKYCFLRKISFLFLPNGMGNWASSIDIFNFFSRNKWKDLFEKNDSLYHSLNCYNYTYLYTTVKSKMFRRIICRF